MRAYLAAAAVLTAGVAAASQEAIPGKRLNQPPTIDGTIDAMEWRDAATFSGMVDQETGIPVDEGGHYWLAYDDQFVYFAAKLQDTQPGRIQASEYRTNVGLRGNDTVTFSLDPFGRLADFNNFTINPRGATGIEIAGGRAPKREWLGDILAKGRIVADGWECEARIPWSVMRLPAKGTHDLRFNVGRDFRRLQRRQTWAFTGGGKVENFGRWLGVELPDKPPQTLKVLPFVYVGRGEDEGAIVNSGVDFRTELTETLDLVGSANPDFRNIENQVLSLDFSYFERLADESRPFFLEGGQFFRTGFDSPLFASQRIANFDFGAKVFGKIDEKTDIGLMDVGDFTHENSAVARIRRQLSSRSSLDVAYVGYESRGPRNGAMFANFNQGFGPYFAYAQRAETHDTELGKGDRTNAGIGYSASGLSWNFDWVRVSPGFFPRLGYAPEVDFNGFYGGMRVRRTTNVGGLLEHDYGIRISHLTRIDGSPYRERASLSTSLTWKDGTDLDCNFSAENFYPYRDRVASVGLERPRGDNNRRWSIDVAGGELGGQRYLNRGLGMSYRPVNELQLGASLQAVEYGQDHFEQAIVSANYDLGRDQSVSSRLVRRDGDMNVYFAFRRSGNRGAEYFLILGDPNATTFRANLVLKATFPFELPFKGRIGDKRRTPLG